MKISKTTLRSLIHECIDEMHEEINESSSLKKFKVAYKTKRGKDSSIVVKARDKDEAMAAARARLQGKMYDLYYAKQVDEASGSSNWVVKWTEFNKKNQLIGKQKFFKTEKARDKFIDKLETKDNFNQVTATSDPNVSEMTSTADVAGYDAPMGTKLTDLVDDEDE